MYKSERNGSITRQVLQSLSRQVAYVTDGREVLFTDRFRVHVHRLLVPFQH